MEVKVERTDRRYKVQEGSIVDLWLKPDTDEVYVYKVGTDEGAGHIGTFFNVSVTKMMKQRAGYEASINDLSEDYMSINLKVYPQMSFLPNESVPWNKPVVISAYRTSIPCELESIEYVNLWSKPETNEVWVYEPGLGANLIAISKDPLVSSRFKSCHEYKAEIKEIKHPYIKLNVIFYNYEGSPSHQKDIKDKIATLNWLNKPFRLSKSKYSPQIQLKNPESFDLKLLRLGYNQPDNLILNRPFSQNFWIEDQEGNHVNCEMVDDEMIRGDILYALKAIKNGYQVQIRYNKSKQDFRPSFGYEEFFTMTLSKLNSQSILPGKLRSKEQYRNLIITQINKPYRLPKTCIQVVAMNLINAGMEDWQFGHLPPDKFIYDDPLSQNIWIETVDGRVVTKELMVYNSEMIRIMRAIKSGFGVYIDPPKFPYYYGKYDPLKLKFYL